MSHSLYIFNHFASMRSVLLQDQTQHICQKFCKHPFLVGRGSRITRNLYGKNLVGFQYKDFFISFALM